MTVTPKKKTQFIDTLICKGLNFVTSSFDAIRHLEGEREFWRARELHKLLVYNRWENFEKVIAKAKVACQYNGQARVEDIDGSLLIINEAGDMVVSLRDARPVLLVTTSES